MLNPSAEQSILAKEIRVATGRRFTGNQNERGYKELRKADMETQGQMNWREKFWRDLNQAAKYYRRNWTPPLLSGGSRQDQTEREKESLSTMDTEGAITEARKEIKPLWRSDTSILGLLEKFSREKYWSASSKRLAGKLTADATQNTVEELLSTEDKERIVREEEQRARRQLPLVPFVRSGIHWRRRPQAQPAEAAPLVEMESVPAGATKEFVVRLVHGEPKLVETEGQGAQEAEVILSMPGNAANEGAISPDGLAKLMEHLYEGDRLDNTWEEIAWAIKKVLTSRLDDETLYMGLLFPPAPIRASTSAIGRISPEIISYLLPLRQNDRQTIYEVWGRVEGILEHYQPGVSLERNAQILQELSSWVNMNKPRLTGRIEVKLERRG